MYHQKHNPQRYKRIECYRHKMETDKMSHIKDTIAVSGKKIAVCNDTISVTYRFKPTPARMGKLDLYGAPGGSRTHAFSSGG